MGVELFSQLEERGYEGRIVSIEHLGDLQEEMEGHHRQGLFDEEFYQTWITRFAFSPPDSLPGARSLIVVAIPQPQFRVVFTWNGEKLPFFIPPTYVAYGEINKQVGELLTGILGPEGYQVARAAPPQKLLAVRSGLGVYGKNNICYIPGMGSFHRLAAFCSDLPCPEDHWQEPQMLERCQTCSACLRNCPTSAITSERFLLRAERCITFHNEKAGDIPFPDWLDPSWHNCLVGCLDCQRICPQNKEFLEWVEEGAEFSPQETALILEEVPFDQLPAKTAAKWKQLGLDEDYDIFPRNLRALLRR
jgi:epoxyqueuosine reductase